MSFSRRRRSVDTLRQSDRTGYLPRRERGTPLGADFRRIVQIAENSLKYTGRVNRRRIVVIAAAGNGSDGGDMIIQCKVSANNGNMQIKAPISGSLRLKAERQRSMSMASP